jgi:phosphoribosylaminoimidazole (AIR) synthetase
MVVVVSPGDARRAADELRAGGETVYEIGTIEESSGEPQAVIV